jgi:hypothetical protein
VFSLADGSYEVFVVEASEEVNGPGVYLELAITTGSRKGDLVGIRAIHLGRDPLSLLGLPGTLTVIDGAPTVTLD